MDGADPRKGVVGVRKDLDGERVDGSGFEAPDFELVVRTGGGFGEADCGDGVGCLRDEPVLGGFVAGECEAACLSGMDGDDAVGCERGVVQQEGEPGLAADVDLELQGRARAVFGLRVDFDGMAFFSVGARCQPLEAAVFDCAEARPQDGCDVVVVDEADGDLIAFVDFEERFCGLRLDERRACLCWGDEFLRAHAGIIRGAQFDAWRGLGGA